MTVKTLDQTRDQQEATGVEGTYALERLSLERSKGLDSTMTGSFVLEFARARLNHVNAFLNRQLTSMREGGQSSDAINEALKSIAFHAEGFDNADQKKDMQDAFQLAANMAPPGSPLEAKLRAIATDPDSWINKSGDNYVTKQDLDNLKTDLESTLKSIDRRSQEDQLFINQKMGEKSEILQLAAMLIQQMNQAVQQILQRS